MWHEKIMVSKVYIKDKILLVISNIKQKDTQRSKALDVLGKKNE